MAYLIKVGNTYNTPTNSYICDTQEEFDTTIEPNANIPVGSEAYIIEEKKTMIKGSTEWIEGTSGGGGSSTSIPYAKGRDF